jgi:hypothetical protein
MWYSAERVSGGVTRENVVFRREGQGCSHQRNQGCSHPRGYGIKSAERVSGLVTREDVVNSQQRKSGV